MNQIDLEAEMVDGGRRAAMARFEYSEAHGNAASNPYGAAILRRFIQPLAEGLKEYLTKSQRGVAGKAKGLIREVDPITLAYITVRGVINGCLAEADVPLIRVAQSIGRTVYGEVILGQFEDMNPELYFTLVNDLERRMTKSEQHRMAVLRNSAKKDGLSLARWDSATTADVGTLLCGIARDFGLVEFHNIKHGKRLEMIVELVPELTALLEQIKGFVAGASPLNLPCVEPPLPWVTANDGGFHTQGMRRTLPSIVRGQAAIADGEVPDFILRGVSTLQSVPWRINERVLEVAEFARLHFDVQSVLVADTRDEKPALPLFMQADPDLKPALMTDEERAEYKAWCSEAREWHTGQKIRGAHAGATNMALKVANRFKGQPIWFVYSLDYRGRAYASAQGVSPQGNDLSKALLEFDRERPMVTEEGLFWFRVAGANKWAVNKIDKAPLEERAQWVIDNEHFICAIADDPISNRDWTDADVPFQFLAWCFEYARWKRAPESFRTRLPLGQDGSCNGLQHFSAMLRDSVGGAATNLVPGVSQQDIYALVASATARRVAVDPDDGTIAGRWKLHELSRSLVKRSVMTLPYGSTRHSCRDFILREYMTKGSAPEFDRSEHEPAARWLSYRVWDGIGEVVVKGREAMEWLQAASMVMSKAGAPHISWRSPSGFLVRQRYHKIDAISITARAISGKRIRLQVATHRDEGDPRRHRNGVAPNFVHSCDASHMHWILARCEEAGIQDLAFIHDDYGCPADQVAQLHRIIRETFVKMYEDFDPLTVFASQTEGLPPIPARGDLDLRGVLSSRYFFC